MSETLADPSLTESSVTTESPAVAETSATEQQTMDFGELELAEPKSPEPQEVPKESATKDDVAQIVSEAFSRIPQSTQAQQQQPQMSQEDIEKALKIAKFDDQFATQLQESLLADEFNAGNVIGVLDQLRDRLMDQATTYADLRVQQQFQEMQKQMAPMLQSFQQQQEAAVRDRFFEANKDLKPFEQLMPLAAQQIAGNGKVYANEAEEFKAIAEAATKLIQQVRPEFKRDQTQRGEPKPATQMRGGGAISQGQPVLTNGADPAIR